MAIPGTRLPASLAQRLIASSGRVGLNALPMLYGGLTPEQAQRAMAQGAGTDFGGQKAQQLTALSGGGAPGDTSGNPGGGFNFPTTPEPISSPGRSGNALRSIFMGGAGRSEGGGFTGGNNLQANGDRYADVQRRGTAPLTMENMGILANNVMGLMGPGVVQTGLASMAELGTGQPPGTYGGVQPFVGHHAIPNINGQPPRSFGELMQAIHEAQTAQAREALQAAARTPGGLNYGDVGMGRRNAFSGYGGSGGGAYGGGGFGAVDSHGQVRGGGYGSAGGGITAGGPR